jgi:hypothetical protein
MLRLGIFVGAHRTTAGGSPTLRTAVAGAQKTQTLRAERPCRGVSQSGSLAHQRGVDPVPAVCIRQADQKLTTDRQKRVEGVTSN